MNTTAIKDGDHYILNGSKNFITHGRSGDIAVAIARTGEKGNSHGMSAFVIEKGTPGFSSCDFKGMTITYILRMYLRNMDNSFV